MKICTFLLFGLFFHLLPILGVGEQNNQTSEGFHIEIRNEDEPGYHLDRFISIDSIKELPADSIKTEGSDGKPGRTWLGVNICKLLEKELHISCDEIVKLAISAPDGYTSVITGELLPALKSGIFVYRISGESNWPRKYGYLRLIFPELRGMYWVNAPDKIVMTMGRLHKDSNQYTFYYLNSEKVRTIIHNDLKGRPYFVLDDILWNLGQPQAAFSLMSQDGVFREYTDNPINRRLILQQEDSGTWKLTGVDVPLGMKLRQVFSLTINNNSLFLKTPSKEENETWHANYFRPVTNKIQGQVTAHLEFVLSNNERIHVDFTNDDFTSILTFIEEQKNNLEHVDHVLITFK